MKIYFTASTTHGEKFRPIYRRIVSFIKNKHIVLSGEQIYDLKELQKDKKLGWKGVFEREKNLIEKADCVIAEVTLPSTGVGTDITFALSKNISVLALYFGETDERLSPMIAGNPSEFLYVEHYNDDNLEIKLKSFLKHIEKQKLRKGKLIVIDGGDGSGKTTQAKMLVNYLKKQTIAVKYMDFPRYYSSFHGKLVGRFLSGEFGNLNEVSPYLASLTYALDRVNARDEMDQWLVTGGYIISNRYVTSNMAHQSAKLPENKRAEFIKWLDELEYRQHKMPRPDLVIYLYVPWQIGMKLTKKKADKRNYNQKKGMDIAEADMKHREESEKMYLQLSKEQKNWVKIDCVDAKNNLLSKQEIFKKIFLVCKAELLS